jgi:hypothetical protein
MDQGKLVGLKLVDFGSSFVFDEKLKVQKFTQEYASPELLIFTEGIKNR